MKAIYKTPKIHVIEISNCEIMAGSNPELSPSDNPVDAGDARAKHGTLSWDE